MLQFRGSLALAACLSLTLGGCTGSRPALTVTDLDPGYAAVKGTASHDVVSGKIDFLQVGAPAYDAFFHDVAFIKAAIAEGRQILAQANSATATDAAIAKATVPVAIRSLSAAGAKLPALNTQVNQLSATAPTDFVGSKALLQADVIQNLNAAKADLATYPTDLTNLIASLSTLPPAGK